MNKNIDFITNLKKDIFLHVNRILYDEKSWFSDNYPERKMRFKFNFDNNLE